MLAWRADGGLESAAVRTPAGAWISIEPRAGVLPPWGPVDRLWLAADAETRTTPLTVVGAIDWTRITTIPPLAEPARLPAGAGTAVLNLLATLAQAQGVERLTYRGPYPTESLFLALLECFRPDPSSGDVVARFMTDELAWIPAPFVGSFEDAAYVQWRADRIEKVVWNSRAYYREDWGSVRRLAPHRVHDEAVGVACCLWALGRPIARHLTIAEDGVPRVVAPTADPAPRLGGRTLGPAVRDGLVALVIAQSAPPLEEALRSITGPMMFTRRVLPLDLAQVDEKEVAVAAGFATALRRQLATVDDRRARAQLALMALTELAATIGDPLRLRAQAWLATAPPPVQATALERRSHDPECARAITAAVEAVVASGGVDDEPDVEGDERGHGDD